MSDTNQPRVYVPVEGSSDWYLAEAREHLKAADIDPSSPIAVPRLLAAQANATMGVLVAVSDLQTLMLSIEERARG